MAILKYKDEDGFWQELPVGTNIAANPPLAGTEANLTGLQVDDTTYKVPVAGEKVSITAPQGATNGTITDEQLAKLQANDANYIEMVNDKELYYLNDNGHVDGYLTYSHVGIENSKATIKTLTITVSAKSFVIVTTVVPTDAGGGKLYRHNVVFHMINGIAAGIFYSTKNTRLSVIEYAKYFMESPGVLTVEGSDWSGAAVEAVFVEETNTLKLRGSGVDYDNNFISISLFNDVTKLSHTVTVTEV